MMMIMMMMTTTTMITTTMTTTQITTTTKRKNKLNYAFLLIFSPIGATFQTLPKDAWSQVRAIFRIHFIKKKLFPFLFIYQINVAI